MTPQTLNDFLRYYIKLEFYFTRTNLFMIITNGAMMEKCYHCFATTKLCVLIG